jgi:DNA modification methylase
VHHLQPATECFSLRDFISSAVGIDSLDVIGFDNVAPILWHKITNVSYEVENGSSLLGKPCEPNSIVKNDAGFILMLRKPGGYRQPTDEQREASRFAKQEHHEWFRQIWNDPKGESTRHHPAPFPEELAYCLVRMFAFAGDTRLQCPADFPEPRISGV